LRDYELVVVFDPDLEIDLNKPLKKVEAIITDAKGKVTKTDTWGKRKLAYTIKGNDFGMYVFINIQLPPESVSKVEATLNITKEVMRYIITNPVPEVVFPGRPEGSDGRDDKDKEAPKKKTSDKED